MEGKDIPDPYRALLVGNHDMTPTLEAHHGSRIEIETLERRHEFAPERHTRRVELDLRPSAHQTSRAADARHSAPQTSRIADTRQPVSDVQHSKPDMLRYSKKSYDVETLGRIVVLRLIADSKPVEFGAIIIHLDLVPPEAREQILECHIPFGTILASYCVEHISRPKAFIRVEPDKLIMETFGLIEPVTLYGRRNVISNLRSEVLADIIEILPP
jgi:chorismate-pyruvate lyase